MFVDDAEESGKENLKACEQGDSMESSEVSLHLLKVYNFICDQKQWITAKDIAEGAGIAHRTARAHVLRLVRLGIVDQAEVFPAHRYKLSKLATKRNKAFVQRLEQAREVFGL